MCIWIWYIGFVVEIVIYLIKWPDIVLFNAFYHFFLHIHMTRNFIYSPHQELVYADNCAKILSKQNVKNLHYVLALKQWSSWNCYLNELFLYEISCVHEISCSWYITKCTDPHYSVDNNIGMPNVILCFFSRASAGFVQIRYPSGSTFCMRMAILCLSKYFSPFMFLAENQLILEALIYAYYPVGDTTKLTQLNCRDSYWHN